MAKVCLGRDDDGGVVLKRIERERDHHNTMLKFQQSFGSIYRCIHVSKKSTDRLRYPALSPTMRDHATFDMLYQKFILVERKTQHNPRIKPYKDP